MMLIRFKCLSRVIITSLERDDIYNRGVQCHLTHSIARGLMLQTLTHQPPGNVVGLRS